MDVFGCAGKLVRVSVREARLRRRRVEKTDIALPPGVSGGYGIGGAEESGNPFSGRAA